MTTVDDWMKFLRYEAAQPEPPVEDDDWERGRDAFRADRLDPRATENPDAQRYLDESVSYRDLGPESPFGYGQGTMRNWQATPNAMRDDSSWRPEGHDESVWATRGPQTEQGLIHGRGPQDLVSREEFIRRFESGANISDEDLVSKYGPMPPFQDPRDRPREFTREEEEARGQQAAEDHLRDQNRWNDQMGDHPAAHAALHGAGYFFEPDEYGGNARYRRHSPWSSSFTIQPTGNPERPWKSWPGHVSGEQEHETLDQALEAGDEHFAQDERRQQEYERANREYEERTRSWRSDQDRARPRGGGSRSRYGPEYVRSGLSASDAVDIGITQKQHFPREQNPKFYGEWQSHPMGGGYLRGRGHDHYRSLFEDEDGNPRTNPDGSRRKVYTVTHWQTPLASYVEGEGWHIFDQSGNSQEDVDRINRQPRVRDLRDDMPGHSWSVTTARRNRDIRWAIRRSGDPIARDEQSWAHDQVHGEIARRAEERANRSELRRLSPRSPGSWASELRQRRGPGTNPLRPRTVLPGQEELPFHESSIMNWSYGLRE